MKKLKFLSSEYQKRFWHKVKSNGHCWIWKGSICNGYGHVGIGGSGNLMKAHRVSWMFSNGNIPKGLQVLHRCDNPSCVRSSHLFLGTHADNMRDKKMKGRAPAFKGELNPAAKLSRKDVANIRTLYSEMTGRTLARMYHVTPSMISHIVNRKNWK